jgi:hypothetical protein
LLHGRLGFRSRVSLDMDEWSYERDLMLDLLATQRRSGWQGGNLVESASELRHGFNQCRAGQ